MTIQREREKAMIDQLVDDNALEAQVHFLYPDTKRLLGVHGMRCLMVANPDPLEVKDRLDHPHNAALENALPLWVNFYRYEATADRGTPQRPRYATVRHSVGGMAVHTGLGDYQAINELSGQPTLPTGLNLWLDFYRLDRSRNGSGGYHRPLPGELFGLMKEFNIPDNLASFQQTFPRTDRNDINFLAHYIQSLITKAEVENPLVIDWMSFWQEIQRKVQAVIEKKS